MAEIYTVGIWTVKAGREDDFIAAWRKLGEATVTEFPAARGTLLRDIGDSRRFVSFGPWDSEEMVAAWRASASFREGVGRMRELLDGFQPGTYELSAEVAGSDQP